MKAPGVHVKAVVVDGTPAYAGSMNLSYTSLTKNREVGLLITEPANISAMQTTMNRLANRHPLLARPPPVRRPPPPLSAPLGLPPAPLVRQS